MNNIELVGFCVFFINTVGHERFIEVTSQIKDWVSSFLCQVKAMVHASLSYHPLWPHYHTSVHDSGNEERNGLWQSTQNLWPYKWKEKQRVRAWAFRSSFIYYNVCSMQWDLHWQHHQSFILQCRKINKLIRIDEYLIARYQNACQVFVDTI